MANSKKDNQEPFLKKHASYLLTALMILIGISSSELEFIQSIERSTYDYRMSVLRGPRPVMDDIVIVAIDDQSYDAMDKAFPWPRGWNQPLLENLIEAEAKLIIYDVQYDEPSDPVNDSIFAAALANTDNVILVSKLAEGTAMSEEMFSLVLPLDEFKDNAYSHGNVGMSPDPDGVYRTYYVGQAYKTGEKDSLGEDAIRFDPTLAVEAFKYLKGIDKDEPLVLNEEDDYFQIGDYRIPTHSFGGENPVKFLINFVGPKQSFQYYSYANVIDDEDFDLPDYDMDMDQFDDPGDAELGLPPGLLHSGVFKDKIVFIGATTAEAFDNKPTPFSGGEKGGVGTETPGVEVHANALQNLLQQNYIQYLSSNVNILILIFIAFLVHLIITRLHAGRAILVTGIVMTAFVGVNIMVFAGNTVIEFARPIITVFFVFTANYVYQYLSSQKEKAMIKGAFAHYVPAKVVDSLIDNPQMLQLGGEEREMSVMFSDVAGFTTISENLTPHELVALLNEYLTAMTDIVLLNDGIIDKYEGDAIMAEWGAPLHFPDHAFKSVHAAILMQRKLAEMRPMWRERGLPNITARIGINTGLMVVGNMGSKEVFDYTVMGDNVNLASRLEGANKPYNTDIMISEATYEQVKDKIRCRELDYIKVKGKTLPVTVFEVINHLREEIPAEEEKLYTDFVIGLNLYRKQQFEEALAIFQNNLNAFPDDGPSFLFKGRCLMFLDNPPDPEWDGVFAMTTK
jgi:adenylate cyclase